MSAESQITTPNLGIDAANGVTYRYRRFGTPPPRDGRPAGT